MGLGLGLVVSSLEYLSLYYRSLRIHLNEHVYWVQRLEDLTAMMDERAPETGFMKAGRLSLLSSML